MTGASSRWRIHDELPALGEISHFGQRRCVDASVVRRPQRHQHFQSIRVAIDEEKNLRRHFSVGRKSAANRLLLCRNDVGRLGQIGPFGTVGCDQ